MSKPIKPTDGRLKANRDFARFMQRAVYEPHARGTFKGEVEAQPKSTMRERLENAKSIDDFTDTDLAYLLRAAMLAEGVQPLSKADNMLAHLRERLERRERAS